MKTSLEQAIFTNWWFCAETKFNYSAISLMKLEHSLNSKLNTKTAVYEVSKSCKYSTCPNSVTYSGGRNN